MQQKIQFIAALLHDPEIVIMDEPMSGLDPVNAALLQQTLIDLRKEGKAILFSTHRMDQAERMCDEIALISSGKLLLSGSMREIKSRYPRNHLQVAFTGDDGFTRHGTVMKSNVLGGVADLTLRDEAAAQEVLAEALRRGTVINRFEVLEPTLEEIFIEVVGGQSHA
jgi:ABC-2 type transport system ATP-binding protein